MGIGAAAGGCFRPALATASQRRGWQPWGTALINVGGSFALGALVANQHASSRTRLLLGTGFCGGFTTFSTFSVEAVTLLETSVARAGLYVIGTNLGCLGAAGVGAVAARSMLAAAKKSGATRP